MGGFYGGAYPGLGIQFELHHGSSSRKYWKAKANQEKQADLMNINEVRQEMRNFAIDRYGESTTFTKDCLYRFTYAQPYDPWLNYFDGWGADHDFTCELFDNCYDSSYAEYYADMARITISSKEGKVYAIEEWTNKFRPQIAGWHVLPVRYYQHYKSKPRVASQLARMTPVQHSFNHAEFEAFFKDLQEIRTPISKAKSYPLTALKALSRAVRRGRISDASRMFFKLTDAAASMVRKMISKEHKPRKLAA
jgi:hypothetical protein